MTLFVDASALVAMIADEADGPSLAAAARDDPDPIWSAISCWETVTALCRSHEYLPADARREVRDVAGALPLRLVGIGQREAALALDAYEEFGKSRHPAKLNMGDCFAYACAKANGARLLYKGNDFARTDLA